jgi:hypothetical protein
MNTRNVNVKTAAQESSGRWGAKTCILLDLTDMESSLLDLKIRAQTDEKAFYEGCCLSETCAARVAEVRLEPRMSAAAADITDSVEKLGRWFHEGSWDYWQAFPIPW